MKKIFFTLFLAIFLVGCIQQKSNQVEEIVEPISEIANPASEFCIKQGGTPEIITSSDGSQGGNCIINGTRCEQWAFFRGECPVNKCSGGCPHTSMIGPDFCKNGNIISGGKDECGCIMPPKCEFIE